MVGGKRKTTQAAAALVAAGMAALACWLWADGPAGGAGKEEPAPVKAVVERPLRRNGDFVFDRQGRARMERRTVTDRDEVARLAAFFPGMGRGKESSIAGGWVAEYTIRFERARGKPLLIRTNDRCTLWTEGQGDWRAKAGLRDFLDRLFKRGAAKKGRGGG